MSKDFETFKKQAKEAAKQADDALKEMTNVKLKWEDFAKDKNKVKKFKNLVDTTWGENQTSPKNPKETQPLYYEDKFADLLKKLGI